LAVFLEVEGLFFGCKVVTISDRTHISKRSFRLSCEAVLCLFLGTFI